MQKQRWTIDLMDRKFLQELRCIAEDAEEDALNRHWKRAYGRLADAANELDAHIARSEVDCPY